MTNHDSGYKLLFGHAPMVADLLRGFVHEPWVEQLDFSSLEKVNASYVSEDLRHREGDVVWRIRSGGGESWLYIYLLIEFQSTPDPFMAVRMLTYLGLFYQDRIRQGQLSPSGKLPPVLPLVLYNGKVRWGAAVDVAELIEEVPGGLTKYQPHLRYFLVDEGRIAESELASLKNLAAALFRLEKSQGPEEVQRILEALLELLKEPEHRELRRSFAIWTVRVFLKARLPGVTIPEAAELQEVKSMLAESVVEWTREWERAGFEKGIERGVKQGVEQGVEQSAAALRALLLQKLTERFGFPVPEPSRRRVEGISSVVDLAELIALVPQADSLVALGLEG